MRHQAGDLASHRNNELVLPERSRSVASRVNHDLLRQLAQVGRRVKLNPLDPAALHQKIQHELPRVARDIESESRTSPGISCWERMAARWKILGMRSQIGDAVLLVRKA